MYLEKEIRHGNVIEKIKYTNGRFGNKKKNGPPIGTTPPEQKEWQRRQDERKIWRLMNENFGPGDLWTTLTYPAKCRPPSEAVQKNIRNFLDRLRRLYKKQGKELKYIYSVGRGKRGAVHIHMVLPKMDVEKISTIWAELVNNGEYVRTDFQPLDKTHDYKKLADYIVKNSAEDFESEDPIYKKRYCCSRNLKKPVEKTRVVKARAWKKDPPEKPGYYIDKNRSYEGLTAYGFPIQYTVYVKLDGRRPPKEETKETGRDGPPEPSRIFEEAGSKEKQEKEQEEEQGDGGKAWEDIILRVYGQGSRR